MAHASILLDAWRESIKPPELLNIEDWAYKFVNIPAKYPGAYTGRYSVLLTPYIRGLFEAFLDPRVREIVIQKGAQTGVTTALYILILYCIVNNPGSTLLVMPSATLAKSNSESRLIPLMENCKPIQEYMPSNPDDFKKLEYNLKNCQIALVGSNSPGNLASRAVQYLYMDETDKYPTDLTKEANPIDLARQRTKTFYNRKVLLVSTPTTEDGYIHQAYERGDKREYQQPCPNCKEFIVIPSVKEFKINRELPIIKAAQEAFYPCPKCKFEINDKVKKQMIDGGRWVGTCEAAVPGTVSMHMPSRLSPWVSYADLVLKYLRAENNPNEMHDFINSEDGEIYSPKVYNLTAEDLTKLVRNYNSETVPPNDIFGDLYKDTKHQSINLLTVDCQQQGFWVEIRKWLEGGSSALILYKFVYTWQEINDLATKYQVYQVFVDSGYKAKQEVYEACLMYKFVPCKGMSHASDLVWTSKQIDPFEGTSRATGLTNLTLVLFDTKAAKDQLYSRLSGDARQSWLIPADCSDTYKAHVTAEQFDPFLKRYEKKKGIKDNHAVDTGTMQIVGATIYKYNTLIALDENKVDMKERDGNKNTITNVELEK